MVRTRKLKKVSFLAKGKRVVFKVAQQSQKAAKQAYSKGKPVAKRGAAAASRGGRKVAKATRQRTIFELNKMRLKSSGVLVKCPICAKRYLAGSKKEGNYWVRQHMNKYHFKSVKRRK